MRLAARRGLCRAALSFAFLAATTLVAGCDSTPGVDEVVTGVPPQARGLTVTPGLVQFEEVSADGRTAFFTISATVDVVGAASAVRFLVQPQAAFETLTETIVETTGDGQVEARLEVELPRDRAGLLSVLAVAVDPSGVAANEARTTVLVERPNESPVIDNIAGPATFTPPGFLRFDVTASDPDGANDLLKVEVLTPIGDRLDLFFVREGFYTASFDVPEGAPGANVFTFIATDRAGAESEPVDFTVTITE